MTNIHLQALATRHGIAQSFTDNFGQRQTADCEVLAAILQALGEPVSGVTGQLAAPLSADSEKFTVAQEAGPGRRPGVFPESIVVTRGEPLESEIFLTESLSSSIKLDGSQNSAECACGIVDEQGSSYSVSGVLTPIPADPPPAKAASDFIAWRLSVLLPAELSCGYHQITVTPEKLTTAIELTLILAPERAVALKPADRPVGVSVQLYSLRSASNWGMGDLTDLQTLCTVLSACGVDTVGVNPLHNLYLQHPERISPYSPSSRRWLNPLYIDVLRVPCANESQALKGHLQSNDFVLRKSRACESEFVDYPLVSALKLEALFLLFTESFAGATNVQTGSVETAMSHDAQQRFQQFVETGGEELQRHAWFESFDQYFSETTGIESWADWPANYQDPASTESRALAVELAEQIEFSCFLQWAVDEQLAATCEHAKTVGLRHGLYMDLAVGIDRQGGEVWASPNAFARGMHIGAPPDALGPLGQDWSLVPYRPRELASNGYKVFVDVLRASMHYAGILRIDHVMGFARQYWCVPELRDSAGGAPGAYINFPLDDLLGIVALESQRNQCLVVGEDLGTVPDGFRQALDQRGLFGYRVLYFEKEADGEFRQPENYAAQTLATASTHDLPTLGGFLNRRDILLRDNLGQFADSDVLTASFEARREEIAALVRLLSANLPNVLKHADHWIEYPIGASGQTSGVSAENAELLDGTREFVDAVHRRLGSCNSGILIVQLEDLLVSLDMANLPGTIDEHPNWQRKSPVTLEELTGVLDKSTALMDIAGNREALKQKAS